MRTQGSASAKPNRRSPALGLQGDEAFRLLVESVRDYAIFMLDPTGRIATWNVGARRLKGWEAGEVIGKHCSIFYPPDDVLAGKCELELARAREDGRFEDEGWRLRKGGERFWANVVITALWGPDEELVGFAKVTRDMTHEREAEERRTQLAAMEVEKVFQERLAAQTEEALRNMATTVAQEVLGVLRGDPPAYPVNDPFQVEHVRQQLGREPLYRGSR